MLAVYLAETGVSRHSSPFLILTDEFNPSPQPLRGREETSERERRNKKKKGEDEGRRGGLEKETDGYRKTEIGEKVRKRKKRTWRWRKGRRQTEGEKSGGERRGRLASPASLC